MKLMDCFTQTHFKVLTISQQHLKTYIFYYFFLAPSHLVHLKYEDSVLPLRYFTSVDHVSQYETQTIITRYIIYTIIKTLIPAQTMDWTTSSFTYRMIETSFCQTPSTKQQILRPSMTFALVEEVSSFRREVNVRLKQKWNETKSARVCYSFCIFWGTCQVQRYNECKASTDWSSFRWKSPSFL